MKTNTSHEFSYPSPCRGVTTTTTTTVVLTTPIDTGNACRHPGYEEFRPDSLPDGCAPTFSDWIHLDPPPCGVGAPYPEEFWNCADIAITPSEWAGWFS